MQCNATQGTGTGTGAATKVSTEELEGNPRQDATGFQWRFVV